MNITFDGWVIFGFLAQFIFFLRFAVQWWVSEKEKKECYTHKFLVFKYCRIRHDSYIRY